MSALGLVGDIGGTNARFGLVDDDRLIDVLGYPCAEHAGLAEAVQAYLRRTGARPLRAALCVAGPVAGDGVRMTNHPWSFSIDETRRQLGFEHLVVINDFAAIAHAVPRIDNGDRRAVGGGAAAEGAPIAVIGAGTGLGVAALVSSGPDWIIVPTEGGHVTLAASTEREAAVIARIRAAFGHVSAERLISGPGLCLLYRTLAELDGRPVTDREPAAVVGAAATDPLCAEALDLFCAFLGTTASNLALSLGARGGVVIAGGIVPKLGIVFDRSPFRARFEAKGRFSDYLKAIPTWVVTHPQPALLGLTEFV